MKVETENLKTIANYAEKQKVTRAYIYKLLTEKQMQSIEIDGVKFIDTAKYKTLPTR